MVQPLQLEEWDHLRIAIREKPLSEDEKARVQVMLKIDGDRLIAFYPESKEGLLYNYDYFFPDDATQVDVFQTVGLEMVELLMNGYPACCIGYGPAATGKTHTFFGSDQEPGLIQLTTKELLTRIENAPQNLQFTVTMNYWEMSNNEIRDALSLENTANLQVRRDKKTQSLLIPGLTEVPISSWGELDDYIMHGNINRIKLSEERGARWHGFVRLNIVIDDTDRPNQITSCNLLFAHLKGPDRVGQKGATGDVLRHGSAINQSMTILGSAILHAVELRRRKLAQAGDTQELDGVQKKLPGMSEGLFTESKLTQVLTGPLTGTVATVMLATVSTLDYHETTDTLENLQNAQQITTTLKRVTQTTEAGVVWKELKTAEAKLPETDLALGHPLTEIEEMVVRLQERYTSLLTGSVPTEEQGQRQGDVERLPTAAATDPRHHQKWKQSVLDSKLHGSRNTIYVPTKGGSGTKSCNTYKGQWRAGLKEGWGEQLTKLTRYEGEWREGMREGVGTLWKREAEGAEWVRVYKGEWRRDKRHGKGVCWYQNGDVYEGYFEEGMRAAVGKVFRANGDKIEGQWKWDKVEGWATQYMKNGDRFEGHWHKGLKEGPGTFYYHEKKQTYKGGWSKDVAKFGVMTDMPKKVTNETSGFLPRVELVDTNQIIAREKEKYSIKRKMEQAAEKRSTATTGLPYIEGGPDPGSTRATVW